MDFSKMKEQMSEKVKEELTQKVDEVKADIGKKFGNFSGTSGQSTNQSTNPVEGQKLDESRIESSSQTNPDLKTENLAAANEEEDTKVVAESDSTQVDDESQDEKEVA